MKKIIALILLLLGLGLGYYGYTELSEIGGSVEIGNLEISAQDSGAKTRAYVLLGGGVLCLILGVGMFKK